MITPSKEALAAALWVHSPHTPNRSEWNLASEKDRQMYLTYAASMMPLLSDNSDQNWTKGFIDGVDGAQAMTDFTDDTRKSVLDKEGIVDHED